MSPDPVARVATPADWVQWRAIRLRALAGAPDAYGSTFELELTYDDDLWRTRLAEGNSVLVHVGEDPVAMGAGFREDVDGTDWFHVVAMWTDPEHRGRGLSHRVLDLLVARATELGLPVHLNVALGNEAALASYRSYGFRPTGCAFEERPGLSCQRLVLER